MLTSLLPLMLMVALGVTVYVLVQRAARRQNPVVGRYPPGTTPEQALAHDREVDLFFHQTTNQLGSDTEEARIGALHALGRLAWENPRLHQPVCGTLDGFIREGLTKLPQDQPPQTLPTDIQTAQTIFGQMTGQG